MPTMNQEKADELKYKIESLFEEYANLGDIKFKASIHNSQVRVSIEEKRTRTPNRPLTVKFTADSISQTSSNKSAAQVLIEAINKAGADNVQSLGIVTSGSKNLVVDTKPDDDSKRYLPLEGGKYAITKTPTVEKEFQIRRISEGLNLNWEVEW